MDVFAAWAKVSRSRQLEGAGPRLKLDDILNAAFAPTSLTNHQRTFMVLKTCAENFTG